MEISTEIKSCDCLIMKYWEYFAQIQATYYRGGSILCNLRHLKVRNVFFITGGHTWSSNSLITVEVLRHLTLQGVFFITHGHMVIKFTYYRGGPETFDIAGCVLYHTWSHGHSVTRGFGFQGLGDQNDDSGIN